MGEPWPTTGGTTTRRRERAEDLPERAPRPQPERREERLSDPGLRSLSPQDWLAVLKRSGRESLDDNLPTIASALAYSSFLAIPSALLVATGLFTLIAGPGTITDLMDRFSSVVPAEASSLLRDSLQNLNSRPGTGVALTVVGFLLALWSTTGAMGTLMFGVNAAYDRKDRRSFLRKRLVALAMVACIVFAFLLIFGLLVLGPSLSRLVGSALGIEGAISLIWWIAQWPILVGGLLAAFAALLYLAPDVDHPRWRFLTPGALFAVVIWLAASGLFAVYTSQFGSYNKTWGSLAAVIILLTWLWLTGIALLVGAEINSEVERSRELRQGEAAEVDLQAPARSS